MQAGKLVDSGLCSFPLCLSDGFIAFDDVIRSVRSRCKSFIFLRLALNLITVRNEDAKVIFLQVSVCPGGGCLVPRGCLIPGGAWSGEGVSAPGGVRIPACTEADPPPPGETATAADGTHPTGMHSC